MVKVDSIFVVVDISDAFSYAMCARAFHIDIECTSILLKVT